ncbi:hypothetical protein JST97_23965 [bacterium]|nr:hypothetical protein [bacterium]
MQTSSASRLATASPIHNSPRSAPPPGPEQEQHDRFEVSSAEHGSGWRGLALAGLAVAGVVGGAQAAQAQVQTAPRSEDLGKVTGLVLPKGRVDGDGTIRNPIGWPVGKVKADGTITGPAGLIPKGHVDDKGRVYKWGEFFPSGRVDSDGTIRNNFGVRVGQVQGQDPSRLEQVEKGGAALLLLLQD